jgi:hypothetical protein
MESKKINQLATELAPDLSDLTIIGDPTTGISKKITLSQMASLFTGTVEEYANLAAFPLVGVADTIYIALDTNILYRWNTGTSAYVELSPNIVSSLVFNDANGFDGTINLVGSVATLTITTALTTGSVGFIGASGALLQDNANFFWDDTNNRLGLGTNAPTTALDVFGSGIIGRINGTSTNNAYLGFASAGTNKWSVGNVQSDHRFRIFSEANSAELISVLQTGEFGIGIANPTTKFHIDGAASALIANLDANVSVAKSISFRSDNSNRINLEVSGTESGSNAGADLFIKTFTDAGSLIETPLSIVRSTGVTTIKSLTLTNALAGTSASFSSTVTATAFIPSGATIPTNGMYLSAANTLNFATNSTNRIKIASTGEVGIATTTTDFPLVIQTNSAAQCLKILSRGSGDSKVSWYSSDNVLQYAHIDIGTSYFQIYASNSQSIQFYNNATNSLTLSPTGAATFSSTMNINGPANDTDIALNVAAPSGSGKFIMFGRNSSLGAVYSLSSAGAATFSGSVTSSANESSLGTASATGVGVQIQSGSGGGGIRFKNALGADATLLIQGTSNTVNYRFDTYSTGAALVISNNGNVAIAGALSKGSGSFKIDHPLESMSKTHYLIHSFVEAPQADLYYRGKIKLVNGKGQANIDEVASMTEGTFEVLCREVQCFTTNESGWDLIKGKVIDNIIYIESQNINSTDEISWLVIGERKDKHMIDTDWTDDNGKVIVEPLKEIEEEEIIKEEEAITSIEL